MLDPQTSPLKYNCHYNFLSYFCFLDVWSFLKQHNARNSLKSAKDLPLPYSTLNIEKRIYDLNSKWEEFESQKKDSKILTPRFLATIMSTFQRDMLIRIALLFVFIVGRFINIVILG